MSTNSEAAPAQIVNTKAPTKAEALVIQIGINDEKNEQQQNINAATSSPTLDDTSQNNKETNGESAPIPSPNKKRAVELTPAPTVKSINVAIDDNEEDDYASKKVVVANYTGNKYVHPGPMTSSLPKPPNNHHNKSNINAARKPSNCLCFELKHIQRDFKGNNYIVCNGLFLCGTDMATYVTTWILMNIPAAFFYWAQFAYLPQHGIPFFVLCLAVSFTCHFVCCVYLVRTNMTDPGILPRFTASEPMHGPFNQHDRFCKTCNIIRPIHAKHCRTCNNCVNGFDHHCPWTGTCVAERNIRYFVGFVTFAGLYGACAFLVSISILINRPGLKELNPMASVGIIIIAGYGLLMSCMLVSMGGSYVCMVGEQLTTNEKIKHGGRLMTDAEKLNTQNISGSEIYCDAFCRKLPQSQIYE